MLPARGYATTGPTSPLGPFALERREPRVNDVQLEILYCGICHSDIHQARDQWGGAMFPMVPGHEMVGCVERVGAEVKRFKKGDIAAVCCFVDSCRKCESCKTGLEQFCESHVAWTYNGTEMDGKTPTFGGYSNQIVADEKYTHKVSPDQPLANVAPLVCAGITTYSPLRRYQVGPGRQVGVAGLGGLGHMAVKLASAMGARVTVFSTSRSKEADARRLGADDFVVTTDQKQLASRGSPLDLVIDTVSASHNANTYLNLLRRDGVLVLVGVPDRQLEIQPFPLVVKRRTLVGWNIGGIRETQEMLDYCAQKKIVADVEIIPIEKVNEAYERTIRGDVRYRFVIDMKTL